MKPLRHRFDRLALPRFDTLRSLLKPLAAGLAVVLLTDVLAGWAVGAAWAMAWLLIAYRLVHSEISGSSRLEGDA
jgi:hypothetical protein